MTSSKNVMTLSLYFNGKSNYFMASYLPATFQVKTICQSGDK